MSSEMKQLFNKTVENFQVAIMHLEKIFSHLHDLDAYSYSALRLHILKTDIEKIVSALSTRYKEYGQITQLFQLYYTQLSLNNCIEFINDSIRSGVIIDDIEMLKVDIFLLENLIKKSINITFAKKILPSVMNLIYIRMLSDF